MNLSKYTLSYIAILGVMAGLVLTGCDDSSQNISWRPGDSLDIVGANEVTLSDDEPSVTEDYFVRAFTIDKNYSWTVNGDPVDSDQIRREGEFVDVEFTEAGTYVIEVDNGDYQGELEVAVVWENGGD